MEMLLMLWKWLLRCSIYVSQTRTNMTSNCTAMCNIGRSTMKENTINEEELAGKKKKKRRKGRMHDAASWKMIRLFFALLSCNFSLP